MQFFPNMSLGDNILAWVLFIVLAPIWIPLLILDKIQATFRRP